MREEQKDNAPPSHPLPFLHANLPKLSTFFSDSEEHLHFRSETFVFLEKFISNHLLFHLAQLTEQLFYP